MEKLIEITRTNLIKAFEQWEKDFKKDPLNTTPVDSADWAVDSADYILSILNGDS